MGHLRISTEQVSYHWVSGFSPRFTFSTLFVTSCMYTEGSKGEMFKVEDGKNKKECVHFVPISGAQNISKFSK